MFYISLILKSWEIPLFMILLKSYKVNGQDISNLVQQSGNPFDT